MNLNEFYCLLDITAKWWINQLEPSVHRDKEKLIFAYSYGVKGNVHKQEVEK